MTKCLQVKLSLCAPWIHRGKMKVAVLILHLSTIWRHVVSFIPMEKQHSCLPHWMLGGHQRQSLYFGAGKILWPCSETNLDSLVVQHVTLSQYWLSCPGSFCTDNFGTAIPWKRYPTEDANGYPKQGFLWGPSSGMLRSTCWQLFIYFLDCHTLDDGTARLSHNTGKQLQMCNIPEEQRP